ncbi:hypothetical protein KM043_017007 [Ampulex compressa]|nr:hypothetical protein KM043_017007 [Ampulex compressa]
MRFTAILLAVIISQVQCRSLACSKLEGAKSTESDVDEQRSSRVHRIARYESSSGFDDNIDKSNLVEDTRRIHEKIASGVAEEINGSKNYEQSQAQPPKKFILKDLSNDPSVKLEQLDVNINEVTEAIVPTEHIKSVLKSVKSLKGPFDNAEEVDIYQGRHENENNEKLVYEDEAKSAALHEVFVKDNNGSFAMNGVTRFDEVLTDLQRQVGWIRKYYNKLCRKQNSIAITPSEDRLSSHSIEFNQPNKISIIYSNST